jgi:site-specific recombinase XerD
MAWAEETQTGWRGGYRDATGRKRYLPGYTTERAAKGAALLEEEKVKRGRRSDPSGARMRWGAWCEQWWPTRVTERSTERSAKAKLDNHVLSRWKDVRLGEITRLDVQRWVLDLTRHPQGARAKPLSASSARQAYYILASSLRAAVAHGLLESSPCVSIRLPELPINDEKFLTDAEVTRLFDEFDEWGRLYVELMLGTGLRVSEASGLHLHRVHLDVAEDPWIAVVETYDHVERVMKPHPKSKASRQVPLTHDLVGWLQRYWRTHPPAASCRTAHEQGAPACRSGLALCGPQGRPIDPHNFLNRQWRDAITRSGVLARPHDLRHTYASRLISAGVEMERVQQLLGHSSIQTTQRYAKLMHHDRARVREALGQSRGAGRGAGPGAVGPMPIRSDSG